MSRTRDFSKGHATTSGNIHIPIGGAVEQHLKYSGTSGVAVWSTIALGYIDGLQVALDAKIDDSQVLTNVPSGALFTDTVYSKPSAEPISYITNLQVALDAKTTPGYVDTKVADLIDSAPGTLDTLNELAAALGDDPNHVTTMTTLIGTKVDDSQVLTNVPSGALFTDTVYSKPSAEPISYITNLQVSLDGKEAADATILKDADIGVNVQAFDSTIVVDADIGTTVLAPDGDGSALTNLPASGGVIEAVASGTLSNGDTVILQSDGTVKAIATASTPISEQIPLTSPVVMIPSTTGFNSATSIAFDPDDTNKFTFVYKETSPSSVLKGVIGTISGTTISFGTAYVLSSNPPSWTTSVTYLPSQTGKVLITWANDSNSYAYSQVADVSGSTLSNVGSPVGFYSGAAYYLISQSVHDTSGRVVISYTRPNSTFTPYLAMAATTGNTTSYIETGWAWGAGTSAYNVAMGMDPNNPATLIMTNSATAHARKLRVRAIQISTSSTGGFVGSGNDQYFHDDTSYSNFVAFNPDQSNSFVLVYYAANLLTNRVRVCSVSGTTITLNSYSTIVAGNCNWADTSLHADPYTANGFLAVWNDNTNGALKARTFTVSGTSFTFGTINTLNSATVGMPTTELPSTTEGKFITLYKDYSTTDCRAILGQVASNAITTNLAADNYIGVSDGAYANAATATIQVVGATDDAQSGLTTGSKQYVQINGDLSTTPDVPSVYAGIALSATKLLIKG